VILDPGKDDPDQGDVGDMSTVHGGIEARSAKKVTGDRSSSDAAVVEARCSECREKTPRSAVRSGVPNGRLRKKIAADHVMLIDLAGVASRRENRIR